MTCKACRWAIVQGKELAACYRYPPVVVLDNASKELPEGRQFFHDTRRPLVALRDPACGEFEERDQ